MGVSLSWGDVGNFFGGLWDDITGVTAANTAAQAQTAGTEAAMETLAPFTEAGQSAVSQMQALSGALGPEAQQAAYDAIQNSPGFAAQVAQGENALLQNASATGGLRGGNTQAALAQFRPAMLNQAIQQQYANLGGLANLGMGAAGGTAGYQNQLGNIGASNAMANYQLQQQMAMDLLGGVVNMFTGLPVSGMGGAPAGGGGVGGMGGAPAGGGGVGGSSQFSAF